jgi:hypothetical protein
MKHFMANVSSSVCNIVTNLVGSVRNNLKHFYRCGIRDTGGEVSLASFRILGQ